jgi:hypothetical protein
METSQEGVFTLYQNKELVGIIKRDEMSKKHLVYLVKEATGEDIVGLIKNHKINKQDDEIS